MKTPLYKRSYDIEQSLESYWCNCDTCNCVCDCSGLCGSPNTMFSLRDNRASDYARGEGMNLLTNVQRPR